MWARPVVSALDVVSDLDQESVHDSEFVTARPKVWVTVVEDDVVRAVPVV